MQTTASTYASVPVDKGISIFQRPGSQTWFLRISRGGKKTRESLHTRRQDLALMIAQRRAEEVLSQRHGVPLARDPLIQDLLKQYKVHIAMRNRPASQRINLDNLKRVMAYIRKLIRQSRPLRVSDFHPEVLESYMRERLQKGISPATINRERSTWASFFGRAARRGILRFNPMKVVDRLPEVRKRLPITLSEEQSNALLAEAAKPVPFHGRGGKGTGNSRSRFTPVHDLVLAALNSGARVGELLHLEWTDIDWTLGRLKIVNKEDHLLKDREDRVVAANELLMEMLRRRQAEFGEQRWVFPSQSGTTLDRSNLLREFKMLAERAGIPWANFNILRHTALTAVARAGAPMAVLREIAGHASSRTTEKWYLGSVGGENWKLPEVGRFPKSVDVAQTSPGKNQIHSAGEAP